MLPSCYFIYHSTTLGKRKVENYFREALQNFVFEEAGGGAIRHLADRGYTARQIADALSFPVPYEKVRETLTGYLMDSAVLLRENPGVYSKPEKAEYVREYDSYGKPSFRRVVVSEGAGSGMPGNEGAGGGKWRKTGLSEFLLLYKDGLGKIKLPAETERKEAEKSAYLSCDFGLYGEEDLLQGLDMAQREYILGICWMKRRMCHLLDKRMLGIAAGLGEKGLMEEVWLLER